MNLCYAGTGATSTHLPYQLCYNMPEPVSALETVCVRSAYVCYRCKWGGIVLVGRLAERRMTHFPRGSKSLHHHQSLLTVEQMRFHSHQALSRNQGCFANWIVHPHKSVGICSPLFPQ